MAREKGRTQSELAAALASCRSALIGAGIMSGVLNVLALTGSLFMLQVYDRVLPSRNVPTLLALTALMIGLYAFQGVLDAIRMRILGWISVSLSAQLSRRFFDISGEAALRGRQGKDAPLAQRDMDQLLGFLSGMGPTALFDLPWMPLYLGVCFLFHPLIGAAATAGAVVLCVLTWLTERYTTRAAGPLTQAALERNLLADAAIRNVETARAMGFAPRLAQRWESANSTLLVAQRSVAGVTGAFSSASKTFRMVLQSLILALGAWLVIHGDASPGIMIASSIMTARALAPVELAIASWKGFVDTRQSWRRLDDLAAAIPPPRPLIELPAPGRMLAVSRLDVAPPGQQRFVLAEVGFNVEAGQVLGVIGASASGKSSLARALVGLWPPVRGRITLDGASLDRWPPEALGRHIGYVPQAVSLLPGTIAENICRFEAHADDAAIIAAAKAAGVHEMILSLPNGYETQIEEWTAPLSAGQKQRIALAVALYHDPFLVVLDEPNSNLDMQGDAALSSAIRQVSARGGIVIVVAHRANVLADVDLILVLDKGRVQEFGPRDEVLKKVTRRVAQASSGNVTPLERAKS